VSAKYCTNTVTYITLSDLVSALFIFIRKLI